MRYITSQTETTANTHNVKNKLSESYTDVFTMIKLNVCSYFRNYFFLSY